jgi:hypothetical protein
VAVTLEHPCHKATSATNTETQHDLGDCTNEDSRTTHQQFRPDNATLPAVDAICVRLSADYKCLMHTLRSPKQHAMHFVQVPAPDVVLAVQYNCVQPAAVHLTRISVLEDMLSACQIQILVLMSLFGCSMLPVHVGCSCIQLPLFYCHA